MKFITPIIAALILAGCKENSRNLSLVEVWPDLKAPHWEEVCTSYDRQTEWRWVADRLGHVELQHRILRPCKASMVACVTGKNYSGDMTCDDLGPKP